MIEALRWPNSEQKKLLASLAVNALSRLPGVLGVLLFLPMLHRGLGTEEYGVLFAALAFGSAATLFFGGFAVAGRREIGAAYSARASAREADAFVSLLTTNVIILSFALAATAAYAVSSAYGITVWIAASLPVLVAFFNTFDNVRAAYNELYVSTTLWLLLQTLGYAAGLLLAVTRQDIVLAALVLQAPAAIASIIAMSLLLWKRPYLLNGRPRVVRLLVRGGMAVSLADGLLMTSLSLSVVWFQWSSDAASSAWFATMVRLFQTFLVPVTLVLLPLSSYVRLIWSGKSEQWQRGFAMITILLGLAYGIAVGIALVFVSDLYVDGVLHLAMPRAWWMTLSIFALFGAIVTYKGYSSISYVVMNISHLSSWTTLAVLLAISVAMAASVLVDPMGALSSYAGVAAVLLVVALVWNALHFVRPPKPEPSR